MAILDRVAAHWGWPLRGVPLYMYMYHVCMSVGIIKV